MHGRLKVKTTEQQKEEKRKKQQKKLELFQGASKKAFLKRENRELDEDALKLTTEILSLNPDFYSLWNFRKEIILEFKRTRKEEEIIKLFKDDLGFTEICLRNNPKSYCAWHHRHWVMQNTPKPDWERELKICNQYLLLDERNFHCWDYRRFVVQESGISNNKELEFSSEKIENNFSNYSAWHYRSKLLPLVHAGNSYKKIDESKLLEEFELVQNAAFTDPNDQSAWFYHRWLLGRSDSVPEVYSFIISKLNENHTVVVSFSSPILINEENKLVLLLNEERVELP
ncbi:Geranylgeranyl transferase type-2 subunit alpha [Nymphon striatum]|nr:Geranylgeranyl transferase type-2 subunit alpha [Nymphon striatum]